MLSKANQDDYRRIFNRVSLAEVKKLFDITLLYYSQTNIDKTLYDIWHEDWRIISVGFDDWIFRISIQRMRMQHERMPLPFHLQRECNLLTQEDKDFSSGKMKMGDD